jgi:hypothetical protein
MVIWERWKKMAKYGGGGNVGKVGKKCKNEIMIGKRYRWK